MGWKENLKKLKDAVWPSDKEASQEASAIKNRLVKCELGDNPPKSKYGFLVTIPDSWVQELAKKGWTPFSLEYAVVPFDTGDTRYGAVEVRTTKPTELGRMLQKQFLWDRENDSRIFNTNWDPKNPLDKYSDQSMMSSIYTYKYSDVAGLNDGGSRSIKTYESMAYRSSTKQWRSSLHEKGIICAELQIRVDREGYLYLRTKKVRRKVRK